MIIDFDGNWSVADFLTLLDDMNSAYHAAARLDLLARQPASSKPEGIDALARLLTPELTVDRLKYGSPGLIEITGALQALTLVAGLVDRIRGWRSDRKKPREMDMDLVGELLDHLPPDRQAAWSEQLLEAKTGLTRPATALAADARIGGVQVVLDASAFPRAPVPRELAVPVRA
jgi:hypothetical protein